MTGSVAANSTKAEPADCVEALLDLSGAGGMVVNGSFV